jgi:hypothetical protein
MVTSWRIGLFIGLAVLGSRTSAFAQAQSGSGPATGQAQAQASTPAASAATAARRPADPSFNRVTTSGRASASRTSRAAYGTGTSSYASGSMGQDDPLRPYSARVREANSRSVIGSTRTPPPQPTAVQPRPTLSYNYYPDLRTSQHPNANVPQARRPHCTPGRGAVMAGGMGRGR